MLAKDKSASGIAAKLEDMTGGPDYDGEDYAARAAAHIAAVPFEQLNGQTYQVEIPDDADLLDWDAPLSQQTEKVREALVGLGLAVEKNPDPVGRSEEWMVVFNGDAIDAFPSKKEASAFLSGLTGEQLYKRLATSRGQRGASEFMLSLGIPGLRYRGDAAQNYVIWDEGKIEVTGTLYQSGPSDVTATPAFRRWFGDSKVVDADGEPLVVYHGTSAEFDAFTPPAFFTDDRDGAQWYATDRGGDVREFYLAINNPLDIRAADGVAELVRIARGAGVEVTTNVEDQPGDWFFEAPEIGRAHV
jgi:hypothetical protein